MANELTPDAGPYTAIAAAIARLRAYQRDKRDKDLIAAWRSLMDFCGAETIVDLLLPDELLVDLLLPDELLDGAIELLEQYPDSQSPHDSAAKDQAILDDAIRHLAAMRNIDIRGDRVSITAW